MLDRIRFPWLLVLVVAVSTLIQHKKLKPAFDGTISCVIGYFMVILGARLCPESLEPLARLFRAVFGLDGGILNSEVFGALLMERFSATGFPILFLGFGINLLLARFTRMHGVYLTSHHYLYLALFTACFFSGFTSLPMLLQILCGGLVLGVWCFGTVSFTARVTRRVTASENCGMANSCACAALAGAAAGCLSGNPKDAYDGEPLNANIPVLAFVSALLLYALLAAAGGSEAVSAAFPESTAPLVSMLTASMIYGAQIALLIHGIRLLVSSIISIFWTLARALVPKLWIGLDASALISYSPGAWQAGFLCSLLSGLPAAALLILLRAPFVPLPSLTSAYFFGGVAGVCGNATGGKRGARLAGAAAGLLSTGLIALLMGTSSSFGISGVSFGETDYGLYGLVLRIITAWIP